MMNIKCSNKAQLLKSDNTLLDSFKRNLESVNNFFKKPSYKSNKFNNNELYSNLSKNSPRDQPSQGKKQTSHSKFKTNAGILHSDNDHESKANRKVINSNNMLRDFDPNPIKKPNNEIFCMEENYNGDYINFKDKKYDAFVEGYYKNINNVLDFKDGAQLILNDHAK